MFFGEELAFEEFRLAFQLLRSEWNKTRRAFKERCCADWGWCRCLFMSSRYVLQRGRIRDPPLAGLKNLDVERSLDLYKVIMALLRGRKKLSCLKGG